jgi:hypothetical protein
MSENQFNNENKEQSKNQRKKTKVGKYLLVFVLGVNLVAIPVMWFGERKSNPQPTVLGVREVAQQEDVVRNASAKTSTAESNLDLLSWFNQTDVPRREPQETVSPNIEIARPDKNEDKAIRKVTVLPNVDQVTASSTRTSSLLKGKAILRPNQKSLIVIKDMVAGTKVKVEAGDSKTLSTTIEGTAIMPADTIAILNTEAFQNLGGVVDEDNTNNSMDLIITIL